MPKILSSQFLTPAALGLVVGLAVGVGLTAKRGHPRPPDPTPIVATVNGVAIHVSELKPMLAKFPDTAEAKPMRQEEGKKALAQMVDQELVLQAALEEDFFRYGRARSHLVELYIREKVPQETRPTDEEARAYFESHKDELQMARALQVLIPIGKSESEAKKKAEMVAKKARDGEDFAKLVKTYSKDPRTVSRGGDLGFFRRPVILPPIADAVFALEKPGDVSDPVRTQMGYHVLKLVDRRSTFEELRDLVEARMAPELRKARQDAMMAALRKKASIATFENNIP